MPNELKPRLEPWGFNPWPFLITVCQTQRKYVNKYRRYIERDRKKLKGGRSTSVHRRPSLPLFYVPHSLTPMTVHAGIIWRLSQLQVSCHIYISSSFFVNLFCFSLQPRFELNLVLSFSVISTQLPQYNVSLFNEASYIILVFFICNFDDFNSWPHTICLVSVDKIWFPVLPRRDVVGEKCRNKKGKIRIPTLF